jgi:hypothetical protein
MLPWDMLDPVYRNSSIQQVVYAEHILRAGGWDVVQVAKNTRAAPPDAQAYGRKMRMMAELEHGRYNAERLCAGWRQGEDEPEKETNPSIVPWRELKAGIRRYDYQALAELPITLAWAGLQLVPASGRAQKPDGQGKPISPASRAEDTTAQEERSYDALVAQPEWKQFRKDMKQQVDLLVAEDEKAGK